MYTTKARKYENGQYIEVEDALTIEEMLSISINGNPYTITMRTPGYEEELTRGILLSEDVYTEAVNPKFSILEKNERGFITKVNVTIPIDKLGAGISTSRNLMSVTSCGMCGKVETDLTLKGNKLQSDICFFPETILSFFESMQSKQKTFSSTGGSHAAAAFNKEARQLICMEDIGRHNAVDKVIGGLLGQGQLHLAMCLIVSGRISYEIVSKCFRAGIPYLAAVSAPSSMAVEFCKEKGIHLFAFCRKNKLTQYC